MLQILLIVVSPFILFLILSAVFTWDYLQGLILVYRPFFSKKWHKAESFDQMYQKLNGNHADVLLPDAPWILRLYYQVTSHWFTRVHPNYENTEPT